MGGGLEERADAFACNMIEAYALEEGVALLPKTLDDPILRPVRSELSKWYLENYRVFIDGGDTDVPAETIEKLHAALTMYSVALDTKKNRRLLSFLKRDAGDASSGFGNGADGKGKYFYMFVFSVLVVIALAYLFWGEFKVLTLEIICGVVYGLGDKQPGPGSLCIGIVQK